MSLRISRSSTETIVSADGEINIVSKPLAARKAAHGQSADETWANAELAAQVQKTRERLFEFVVNIHVPSIGQNV